MTRAVAYLRTSSATNVGGDSDKRQRDAIVAFAERNGYTIVGEFYDAGVSGADHVMDRPGFAEMFAYVEEHRGRCGPPGDGGGFPETCATILVENASRFARDLAVQIAGYDMLVKLGITLIPVDAPNHFLEDTPTAVMVRNILGAVSQFEKDNLVAKLRKARDRKREETGKCGGRRSHKEMHPDRVERAKKLRNEYGLSLAEIALDFSGTGWLNEHGHPYSSQAISAMIRQ